ncbi:armadillo-type protein [Staphylotrichum tortipilum]|uniref:Armadillo-type protein n=1 Tax=Staphylotrichum tortipilum TaxID=2831512 RepID=A0AAN6RVE3_9PEZI|nr:armadillo-type protein [Staphylotrichum longicolle]
MCRAPVEAGRLSSLARGGRQRRWIKPRAERPREAGDSGPHLVHLGDDSATVSLTLSKCPLRAYYPACQTVVDLIDDSSSFDPAHQQLRLQGGTRRPRAPAELAPRTMETPPPPASASAPAAQEGLDGHNTLLQQVEDLYMTETVLFWPPKQDPADQAVSFILWSALAKVYEKDFAPFLPGVFTGLFESLKLEEEEIKLTLSEEEKGIIGTDNEVITAGKKLKIKNTEEEDEDWMDDDEDDDDYEDFGVSPEALEKEVAMEILGDVITYACGTQEITEYLEKAVESISPLTEHSYEGCRKAAVATLWRSYARVWQLMEQETGSNWEPGLPLKQTPTVTLVKLGEIVAKASVALWNEEADRSVVTEINRNVAATLKACGPAILAQQDFMKEVVTVISTLITRSHPCQQDLGDEDEDQEVEGTSEYDWLVIDTALDVVIGLAVALGSGFAELWKIFEKPILKFAGAESENIERSTGVGVIAECAANMGSAVTPYTAKLLNLLIKRLSDTDPETKSNAAYATGQLIFNSTDSNTYLPQYSTILQKLEPMLQVQEARIKDNAAGCISRLTMSHPDQIPLGEVLPALVGLLPLKEDYDENSPVYECILKLYESNEPTVQQLTPQLINAFEAVLSPPEEQLDDDTREIVRKTVFLLYNANQGLFSNNPNVLKLAGVA